MPKTLIPLSVLLLLSSVLAGAARPTARADWKAVEALVPGTLVEVMPALQAGVDLCRVSWSDAHALTCLREGAAADVRLVFPQEAVGSVWRIEPERDHHVGRWLVAGLGFFLGAGICSGLGPGGIVACGFAGAGMAAGAVLEGGPARRGWAYPPPPRPSRPPPWHRRIVYEAQDGLPALAAPAP